MCKVKTSRALTRSHLISNDVIDKYNNILDLKKFRKLNTLYSDDANTRFNTPRLMFEENGKVIFNDSAFRLIDAYKGIFYPDNQAEQEIVRMSDRQFDLGDLPVTNIPEPILDTLVNFLRRVNPNFRLEILDKLNDNRGMSVNGITKLNEFLIQIKKGNESAIPEEVAHVFVEMLDKNSDLYKEMDKMIVDTPMYKHVLKEYGNHPEYAGNYSKLRREAIAKLVSLYTHDKKLAQHYSGSLWSRVKSYIQNFLLGLRDYKNPFEQSAMRILNLETTDLLYANALVSETMYQIHDISDFQNYQSINKELGDYDTVLVNINDVLFDLKAYTIPDRPSKKDPKKIIKGKDIKGLMWNVPNSVDLAQYYSNVRLTKLGREVKDKIKVFNRFTFFTSGEITQELKDRIELEFGPVRIVNTRAEDLFESEDGGLIIKDGDKNEIILQNVKGKTLVIDNTKDIVLDGIDFIFYNNARAKYTDYGELVKRRTIEQEAKEFSDTVLEEFSKLSPDNIVGLAKPALNLISRIVNRLENGESFESISEMFKDEFGNLTIPVDRARQIVRQLEENSTEFSQGLLNFINSIGSTTLFWENANKSDYKLLRDLLQGSKEDINKGIKDAASLMRMTLQWEDWLNSIQPVLSHPDFEDTKVIKEKFAALRTAIGIAKSRINTLSVDLLSTQLADLGKDYNQGKMAAFKAGHITKEEYEDSIITPQKLANIIFGLDGDVAMSAYFENSLFIGDDLVQTVSFLVEKGIIGANQKSLENSVNLVNSLDSTEKNETIGERVTYLEKENFIEDIDGEELMSQREVLTLLNPHKDLWIYEAKKFELNKARKKFLNKRAENADEAEIKKLEEEYNEAFKSFKSWEKQNWHREYQTETWEIYETFGLVGEDFDRALEFQQQLWDEKKSLISELKNPNLTKEEQLVVSKTIEAIDKRLKNLRNPFDLVNNKQKEVSENPEEDIRIANILREKHKIDRQLYEYGLDEKRFLKDINEQISKLSDVDLQRTLVGMLDTKNPLWLKNLLAVAESRAPQTFIDWVESNTKVTYSPDFYEKRKKILDDIKKTLEELSAKLPESRRQELLELNKKVQEGWETIFNMTSSLRDEDNIFDASDSSLEHQKLIKEAELDLVLLKDAINLITPTGEDARKLRLKLKELIGSLKSIQSKGVTDYYNDVMFEKLENIFPKELGRVFQGEDYSKLIETPNFKEFLKSAPADFKEWFHTNHYLATYTDFTDTEVSYWKPTYIWMKISPTNDKEILLSPTYKYSERKFKDSVVVEYNDRKEFFQIKTEKNENTWNELKGVWLPKSEAFRNEAFYKLGEKDKAYLKKITKFYLDAQADSPRNVRMGYKLPFMEKTYTDGGGLASLWRRFANKSNPAEAGEENAQPTARKKLADRLRAFAGIEKPEPKKVGTDLLGNRVQTIHTPYRNYIDEKLVTRDILTSVLNFTEGLERTKALVSNIPELNLLEQLLEQFNPFEKDVLGSNGKRVKSLKNRRLEVIQNIKKTKLFGDVKDYELGKGVDNVTLSMRHYTSFMSQSILNPANSLKNYIQGQLTNMVSAGEWASSKDLLKAMKSTKTSFIPFLHELGKKNKSLDFQIITLFNLSLSDKITDLYSSSAGRRQFSPLGEKFRYISSEAAEFSVTTTLLFAHLDSKKVTINGEQKSLYDIFYLDNGVLKFKEAYDGERLIDQDYINELILKAKVVTEHVQGKQFNSTIAQRYTIWRNFEFFKKYFIPKLRERFVTKRKNLVMGEDIEGFYVTTFKRFLREVISYLDEGRFSGVALSPLEKAARLKMTKELLIMLSTYMIIALVFGYDDDDDDKNKKLEENSWATNFLLMTILSAKKETDAASIIPLLNVQESVIPPLLSETYNFVKEPFMGFGIFDNGKKLVNASFTHVFNNEDAYYEASSPSHFIEKGDSKLDYRFMKLLHYDTLLYLLNPDKKIEVTQSYSKG